MDPNTLLFKKRKILENLGITFYDFDPQECCSYFTPKKCIECEAFMKATGKTERHVKGLIQFTCHCCGKAMKSIVLWNYKVKGAVPDYKCHEQSCSNYMKMESYQSLLKEDKLKLQKEETYSYEDYEKD